MFVAIVQTAGDVVYLCGYDSEDLKRSSLGRVLFKM